MNKKKFYSSMLDGMLFFLITTCASGSLFAGEQPSSEEGKVVLTEEEYNECETLRFLCEEYNEEKTKMCVLPGNVTEDDLKKIREALKHTEFGNFHRESAQPVFSKEVTLERVLELMKVANYLGYKRVVDTAVQTVAHRWQGNNYSSFQKIKFPQLATDLCCAMSRAINIAERIVPQYLSQALRKVEFPKRSADIRSLSYSSDGSKIAVGFEYGGFEIVDTRNNCKTVSSVLDAPIYRCLFCKEDSRLVIQDGYDLKLMDAVQGIFIKRLATFAPLSMASCAPYRDAIAITRPFDSAQICDLETGSHTPIEGTRDAHEILFNAARMAFLYNRREEPSFYKLFLRDMRADCSIGFKTEKEQGFVDAFDISSDGTYVAGNESVDDSDEVKIWDVRMPQRSLSRIALLFKTAGSCTKDRVKFIPHRDTLFVGRTRKRSEFSFATEWKLWDMREQQLQTLELPQCDLYRTYFPEYVLGGSPTGNEMAVYNVDNPKGISRVNFDGLFALQAFLQQRPIKEQLLMAQLATYRVMYLDAEAENQMNLDTEERKIVREWDAVAENLLGNGRRVTPDYMECVPDQSKL